MNEEKNSKPNPLTCPVLNVAPIRYHSIENKDISKEEDRTINKKRKKKRKRNRPVQANKYRKRIISYTSS